MPKGRVGTNLGEGGGRGGGGDGGRVDGSPGAWVAEDRDQDRRVGLRRAPPSL